MRTTYAVNGHEFSGFKDAGGSVVFTRDVGVKKFGLMISSEMALRPNEVEALVYLPDEGTSHVSIPIPQFLRVEGIAAANARYDYVNSIGRRARVSRGLAVTFYNGDDSADKFPTPIAREDVVLQFPISGASTSLRKPVGVRGTYMAIGRWDSRVCYLSSSPDGVDITYDRGQLVPSKVFAHCKIRVDRRNSKRLIELSRAALNEREAMHTCGIQGEDLNKAVAERYAEKFSDMSLATMCKDDALYLAVMASGRSAAWGITDAGAAASTVEVGANNIAQWSSIEIDGDNPFYYESRRDLVMDVLFKRGVVRDEHGMHEMLYDGTV